MSFEILPTQPSWDSVVPGLPEGTIAAIPPAHGYGDVYAQYVDFTLSLCLAALTAAGLMAWKD